MLIHYSVNSLIRLNILQYKTFAWCNKNREQLKIIASFSLHAIIIVVLYVIWPRTWNFDPNKICLTVFVDDFVSTNRAEYNFFLVRWKKKNSCATKHSYSSVRFCLLCFLFQRSVKRTQSQFGIEWKHYFYE